MKYDDAEKKRILRKIFDLNNLATGEDIIDEVKKLFRIYEKK